MLSCLGNIEHVLTEVPSDMRVVANASGRRLFRLRQSMTSPLLNGR